MTNVDLLAGWQVMRLGEVGHWGSGGTPKRGVSQFFGGDIPWLKSGDLNDGVVSHADESITADGLRSSSAKLVEPGTLLIAMYGATIGRLGVPSMRSATNQAIAYCVPHSSIVTTDYLFELLLHMRPELVALGKGGAQPNISQEVLKAIEIPIPPLDTQATLVHLLKRVRSRTVSVTNHVGAGRQAIAKFRQGILAAACSGRLTSSWRERHPDAVAPSVDALRQSNSKSRAATELFASEELSKIPETWRWVPLSSVSNSVLGKMLDKTKNRGEPRPYLRNINVRWRGFDLSDVKEMRFEAGEEVRYGLLPGDVMVCEGGEPGRAAVWREVDSDMRFQKALHRVRCDASLLPDWLVNVLQAYATSGRLANYFTGSGIEHLTGVSLARVPIPLPPVKEQVELVSVVERLFHLADAIEGRVLLTHRKVDHTSQAVLAKAFRGELIASDDEGVARSRRVSAG